jgi:ATP-dependent Clp protease adapter protein ClpS
MIIGTPSRPARRARCGVEEEATCPAGAEPPATSHHGPVAGGGGDAKPGGGGSSTETAPAVESDEETEESTAPGEGWAVILHNDEVHSMAEVVLALHIATGFDVEQCFEIMERAHLQGKAVVTITGKEEAERIVSILLTFKLTATLRQM